MRHRLTLVLGLFGAALCGGCHSGNPPIAGALGYASSAHGRWVRSEGGPLTGATDELARLQRLCDRVAGTIQERHVRPYLLPSDQPAAYAWPDGSIYVTRGLMAQASEEQVMAAIAHELGHLLDDGYLRPQMALRGGSGPGAADRESRADLMAVRILQASGVPPTALVDLLRRLQDEPTLPAGSRQRLAARITRLAAELASLEAMP